MAYPIGIGIDYTYLVRRTRERDSLAICLERFREISHQSDGFILYQAVQARFQDLVSTDPALVYIFQGTKNAVMMGRRFSVTAGEFILMPDMQAMHIENIPAEQGPYQALFLPLNRAYFERAYRLTDINKPMTEQAQMVLSKPSHQISELYQILAQGGISASPLGGALQDLKYQELILLLAEANVILPDMHEVSLSDQVKAHLQKSIGAFPMVHEMAVKFAMSEASFRRKLASENNSYRHLCQDVSMCYALFLLQTSDQAINQIAMDVGYESASKFAQRFRTRFGVAPGDIRKMPSSRVTPQLVSV